jgi:hypothetical protein
MNFKMIEKLRQLPRHGVLPRSRAAAGLANLTSPASASPTATPAPVVQDDQNDINQQIQQAAQALAQEIVAEQLASRQLTTNGQTHVTFGPGDIVDKQKETVTAGLWSDGIASLTTFFTSSTQTTSQRKYYVDVHQTVPSANGSACQFSIAYGHALGSGSDSAGQLNDSPSKAIYSQYRQLLLNPGDTRFTTGDGDTDHIYVINFKRNRLKEKLDAGNFELPLQFMSASLATNATASNVAPSSSVIISLIDDSSTTAATVGDSGDRYNIVSGSINTGVFNSASPVYYGLAYPSYGVLILDGNKLDANLNFQTNSGSSSEGSNHFRLFHSISGSPSFTNPATADPYGFLARNKEEVTSQHFFVRVKNAEFNFSNNPSFVTGSDGEFLQPSFVNDPKVYITTVGLYNNSRELLAVAKLSKPLLKSFTREALIRVKLDY